MDRRTNGSSVATRTAVEAASATDVAGGPARDADEDLAAATPPSTAKGAARRRRRRPRQHHGAAFGRLKYKVIGLLSVIVGLGVWQVFAETGVINRVLSSAPSDVFHAFGRALDDGSLQTALVASAKLYGTGLAVSITIGIVFGVVLGWWRVLGAIFDPWIAVLYSTPLIALLPLILVWFGIGFQGQVVMVVLVSVFPLLVNVMAGSRQVDDNLLRLATSFRASQWAVLRSLVLPSLVPFIITGVRLAVGTGLIGVVLAEYFEGTDGIGGLILKAGVQLDSARVFVGIVILACTALVLTGLIRVIERRISSWREV